MGDFKQLFGKFMMAALIILPLLTLIVVLQADNNSPERIQDNNVFNQSFGSLVTTIDNATTQAGEKYDVFNQEIPQTGFGSILLFGIVSVTKTFSNVVFSFFISLIKLPLLVFGVPASIFNLLITWLTIFLVVVVWQLIKLGG